MNLARIHLKEVGSTNSYLKEKVDRTNVLVTADYQTMGRGQGQNTWESEAERNLLFSIKVSPSHVLAKDQFVLSMAGALSIEKALEAYGSGFSLKWPNDIYYHDSKISGTLIETTIVGRSISDCIFGIGVNVNQKEFPSAPNPISLSQITKREMNREELLADIIKHFEKYYKRVEKGDYEGIYTEYNARLYRKQEYFSYEDKGGVFVARILRVEHDGHLLLEDESKALRKYEFKELKFII